ncbi:MAG: hypothetical protein EHM51_02275 [Geobacter sp.]|nr:MAG: hypothetical protein EHM51_02275 [Geobacter sp.]
MKSFLKIALLSIMASSSFGCAQNYYNIPAESYAKKVRVLGVAPIFTDAESDIRHPEKEALIPVIEEMNRKNESELVARLKDTGAYLSVRTTEGRADQLFSSLFFRRERRSDAGVVYNKYFFKQPELKELIEKNSVDAVMVVVASGLTKREKLYSSNYLSYLEQDYNFLTLTAQILDAQGNILWEYPNFQQKLRSLTPLLNLQYADFDEAEANVTDKVDVKFKTVPGITRALGKIKASPVRSDVKVSSSYQQIFDEMVSTLKPQFRFPWEKAREETGREEARPEPQARAIRPVKPEQKAVKVQQPAAAPAVEAEPAPLQSGEIKTESLTPAGK